MFGLVIAEAMACAAPVVATNVGGIPEVFVHQEHGLLVSPADPVQMADAVGTPLREPGLRRHFRQQAAAYARQRYDQETMIDAYLDWFSDGLSQRNSQAV